MQIIPPLIDKRGTAKRIRCLMERNCLKPADIQRYLGLTCVQTVYRWLEGVNIPTVDNLYALSQLFGVKMDDMIAGNRQRYEEGFERSLKGRMMAYYKAVNRIAA